MENWLYIPGTDCRYAVSDLGRVWSYRSNKLLKPGLMSGGHLSVALGRGNSRCVHELVLTTFRGPAPEGYVSRHLDGKHENNKLTNLEWATRTRNGQDKKWHDGQITYTLTPLNVVEIRELRANGVKVAELADKFDVCQNTIRNVLNGKTHSDV